MHEALSKAMMELTLHNDVYVLNSAMCLRQSKHHAEAMEYLLCLLKNNPYEEEALCLIDAEAEADRDAEGRNWTDESVEGLLVHLDVCHPDCLSVQHCCEKWRALLVFLTKSMDKEMDEKAHVWLREKIDWWRVYFFSPFAVRSMVQMHGSEQLADLLYLLGKVACCLMESKGAFLQEVRLHLGEDQRRSLRKFERKMRREPPTELL